MLLFLFMFTYTLLGMEMFAYKVQFDANDKINVSSGSSPDSNFDFFLEAFASVFIVLANDGWSTIYFQHYRVVGAPLATFYFISLIVIG